MRMDVVTLIWLYILSLVRWLLHEAPLQVINFIKSLPTLIPELLKWLWDFIWFNFKPLAQIIVIPGLAFILLFAMIAVWFERKFLARAMLRIGPYYCGKRSGWLQVIADFLKLFFKEFVIPDDVEKALFLAAPVLLPTIPALAITLIPFDSNWVLFDAGGLSLPVFLAIAGLAPVIPIFAGWAANNKYTIIGSFRTAYLYVSGEIPLVICAAATALLAGSLDLVDIVEAQRPLWFAIPQFIGFLVFFVGLILEAERTPFDVPTAETELVIGWRTEFSGVLFGFTMMAEYVSFLGWTLLFIVLYLGGYLGPSLLGVPLYDHIFWMLLKLAVIVVIVVLIRTVYPRLRLDQTLRLGWNYLMPLALLNLFITIILKWGLMI
ncbi:NADH-quinone oxidoreductase subunit NuoH [Candidatus Bathyarchaeota archaeon]|nr:MAG: NADH-quinone oxidoreductase subunit NuoH [Candidatus Bathyarchaeota archaeon]